METLLTAGILGIIEGLTEFLPVSSSGHLTIASQFFDFTGQKAPTYNIVIQMGAIAAVVIIYWSRFFSLLTTQRSSGFSGLHGFVMLVLTTMPAAALGLLLHNYIKLLFTPLTVAMALVCGALFMFAVEWKIHSVEPPSKATSLDHITLKQAVGVGLYQCLALWPGFSRSAATIMGGMLLGISRKTAAEYSFIAAVPIITGAALYELYKTFTLLNISDIPMFLTGSVTALIAALLAIRMFITLLGRCTLIPFAIYRIFLAIPVYYFLAQ
jgi:undecaprenyl-diphosphatase